MSKIEIEIDAEKKGIKDVKLPEELNPAEIVMIFNSISTMLLSKMTIEKKGKIEVPKSKLVLAK